MLVAILYFIGLALLLFAAIQNSYFPKVDKTALGLFFIFLALFLSGGMLQELM